MKLKVVWICHFTNQDIQNKLGIKKNIPEMAPWISLGIDEVKKRDDIELHIVSPYPWIMTDRTLVDENIHYHFFNSGMNLIGRHWPQIFRFDIFTNFRSNKKKVANILNKINPDIVHLHGFENSYYSSTILQFIGVFPILVTVQGFISLQEPPKKITTEFKKRLSIEREIITSLENFGVRTEHMTNVIANINGNAKFFWHEYFLNASEDCSEKRIDVEKSKYDLIFFARISKEKGIEDLIVALGILKKDIGNIRLAIVGSALPIYIEFLKELAVKNDCLENIDFLGFQQTQEDVFKILLNSKISVLPTYNDIIPGTIIESMLRKIPVVTYKTGGIPSINTASENIIIVEQGNTLELAIKIKKLLNNKTFYLNLTESAYSYAIARWDNSKALSDIVNIYHKILNHN